MKEVIIIRTRLSDYLQVNSLNMNRSFTIFAFNKRKIIRDVNGDFN